MPTNSIRGYRDWRASPFSLCSRWPDSSRSFAFGFSAAFAVTAFLGWFATNRLSYVETESRTVTEHSMPAVHSITQLRFKSQELFGRALEAYRYMSLFGFLLLIFARRYLQVPVDVLLAAPYGDGQYVFAIQRY